MAGREVELHRRVVFGAIGGLVSPRQSVCLRRQAAYRGQQGGVEPTGTYADVTLSSMMQRPESDHGARVCLCDVAEVFL